MKNIWLQSAQETFDAFELVAETFDKLCLFVLQLHETLSTIRACPTDNTRNWELSEQ
jgi:hypothetical protein